jgi:hypothetical protein
MEKEKRNNNNLFEATPKKTFKNLIIFTLLLINIPLFTSKKLIIEKNIFIDDCSKDDIYQYEYNNICYISCPRGTQVSKTNKNLCENKYQMLIEINATNKTYEINNSSSSLNNIFNKVKLRKLQPNDEDDEIIILRNKIKNKTDSDMTKLLKGELEEIKETVKGITYQIITSNYQNGNDNDQISTVKLGECEENLKKFYNINQNDPLIIFKFDYYKQGLLVPIIEYEVYDNKRNILNLNICKNIGIEISVPLLTEKEEEACVQLCDEECVHIGYSSDKKKYICKCEVKESLTIITGIEPQSWNKEGIFKEYCELKNGNVNMDKNQIIETLKQEFVNGNLDKLISDVIEGNDIIIKNKNFLVQITTTNNQRNDYYHNLSIIDLGECENRLKAIYAISNEEPLFIFKVDSYNEDSLIPTVEYVIYQKNKNKYNKVELDGCKNIKIDIKIPTDLSAEETERYNLSNNEICYSYESENGRDVSLKDRKKEEKILCQYNCIFEGYNYNTKMINCGCEVKDGISLITEITIDKNDKIAELDNFFSSDSSKSINLFECISYFFSKEGFQNNSGSYILLCLISLNIVIFVIFFTFKGRSILENEISKFSNFNQISNNNNAAINNNIVYNNGYNINNGYNNNSGYNNNLGNNDITHVNDNNNSSKIKKKGRSNKKKNSQKSNKGKTTKKNENIPQISFPPKKNKINKNNGDLKVNVDSSQKPDSNIEFRNIENQGNVRNIIIFLRVSVIFQILKKFNSRNMKRSSSLLWNKAICQC